MPTPSEITTHHDALEGANPFVNGPEPVEQIDVVPADPLWPAQYESVARELRGILGERIREIQHVGSTSVPGLAAKPIIDIDIVVDDPGDEDAYIPLLTQNGFVHTIREPWWHEHRMLRRGSPRVNLHVFGPDCPETIRHRIFRDHLRSHLDDRERYEQTKRRSRDGADRVSDYNLRKQPVIREIYERAFRELGLL